MAEYEKHGDHTYKFGEKVSWEDTFKEEGYDMRDRFIGIGESFYNFGKNTWDICLILWNMSLGFFNRGRTFVIGF